MHNQFNFIQIFLRNKILKKVVDWFKIGTGKLPE